MIPAMDQPYVLDVAVILGSDDASDPSLAPAVVEAWKEARRAGGSVVIDLGSTSALTTAFLNAVLFDVLPSAQAGGPSTRFRTATALQREMLSRSLEGVRRILAEEQSRAST